MTEALIANESCTVSAEEIEAPASTVTGTVAIVTPASSKDLTQSDGVYSGELEVLISGCVDSGSTCTQTAPQPGNIKPSATKGIGDGGAVIREGDTGDTVEIIGTIPSSGAACTIDITPLIKAAGQNKAFSR
jgi:hypothetical protein